jgi:chorismate synthase
MSGSSFGRVFTVTTYGESHGRGIGAVVDGVPPGVGLSEADIQTELDRRRPGQSRVTTPRKESDRVQILSGVFEGRTTGTPVALFIPNRSAEPGDYEGIRHLYRPGHADFTYQRKYGFRDWRGSGRASGRETAARVAAGAVARKVLVGEGVEITAYVLELGGIRAENIDYAEIENNPVRCPDPEAAGRMVARIEEAQAGDDSLGGIVEAVARGVPVGLGEPVFDRLDALLAQAVMSIGAVKGFELGLGFGSARVKGSQFNDPFYQNGGRTRTRTNNAGGILGGISTGEPIVIRAAVRPPASIARAQDTVDLQGLESTIEVHGRHDPCIAPRIVPVIEAMIAVTLLDALLMYRAYGPWIGDDT